MNTVFFDPESPLNQLRAGFDPGEKVYGFFLHLLHQHRSEGDVRLGRDPAESPVSQPGVTLAAASQTGFHPKLIVLALSDDGVDSVGASGMRCEVIPAVDPHSRDRLHLGVSGIPNEFQNRPCRVLFVHPRVVERLRDADPRLADDGHIEHLMAKVVTDEYVAQNSDLAKIIACLPELEGTIDDDGDLLFHNVLLPPGSSKLTPEAYLVVVVDGSTASSA